MASNPKRSNRLLVGLMVGMMAAAAAVIVVGWQLIRSQKSDQAALGQPKIGGAFTLTDQTGRTITDQSFRGSYELIYFGYTSCPDTCPTELQSMAQALQSLGPAGEKVQPIFITVDPERDTVKQLAGYVPLFTPRLEGLTGTQEQVAQAAKAFKVYYAKAEQPNGAPYLMNHSSFFYLMGPDGGFVTLLEGDTDPDKMAAEIKEHMTAS